MHFSKETSGRGRRVIATVRNISCAALLGFIVAACAGGDAKSDRQVAVKRVNAYLAATPGLDGATAAAMRRFVLRKDMTPQQVQAVWGPPRKMKKWQDSAMEQWYFGCDWPNTCAGTRRGRSGDDIYPQAFFENGRLSRWKN